jgi:hypothetical protein
MFFKTSEKHICALDAFQRLLTIMLEQSFSIIVFFIKILNIFLPTIIIGVKNKEIEYDIISGILTVRNKKLIDFL